jgi:Helix-hairpin-helix motif
MPTPAEQKALAFVALVILLGGAVRVFRVWGQPSAVASAAEQAALDRQTYSADSLAGAERRSSNGRNKGKASRRRRDGGGSFDATGAKNGAELGPNGFPPPGPRIDTDVRASPTSAGTALIDLDVAGAAEIERLPRVGPALARRIVASRDSLGPFGGLAALTRVKGIGPATAERLAPLVTFSGQARR